MNRKNLYIGISIVIFLLIVGLIGWALFIGHQKQTLDQSSEDIGFFDDGNDSRGSGFFGGAFDNEATFGTNENQPGSETTGDEEIRPKLVQLYNLPTAGYAHIGTSTVRFVDRATGHVLEKNVFEESTTRIDQTTVPRVYRAFFSDGGFGVTRQYVNENDDIVSVYTSLDEEEFNPTELPLNISDVAVRINETEFAILRETPKGSVITLIDPVKQTERDIFESTLRDWHIMWNGDSILATQKASGTLPGNSIRINPDTQTYTTVLRQQPGLITASGSSPERILYTSFLDPNRPLLSIRDTSNGSDYVLDIFGFAEKCIWGEREQSVWCALPTLFPTASYPEAWYQGDVRFNDDLWRVDIETRNARRIISPVDDHGVPIDMVDLAFNEENTILFFVNNIDQTLWAVTIPEKNEQIL